MAHSAKLFFSTSRPKISLRTFSTGSTPCIACETAPIYCPRLGNRCRRFAKYMCTLGRLFRPALVRQDNGEPRHCMGYQIEKAWLVCVQRDLPMREGLDHVHVSADTRTERPIVDVDDHVGRLALEPRVASESLRINCRPTTHDLNVSLHIFKRRTIPQVDHGLAAHFIVPRTISMVGRMKPTL